jgi:hypothetical protein
MSHTDKLPLRTADERVQIDLVLHKRDVHLGRVVAPQFKEERAKLIVEWKPADVDGALRGADLNWGIEAKSRAVHSHMRLLCRILLQSAA